MGRQGGGGSFVVRDLRKCHAYQCRGFGAADPT